MITTRVTAGPGVRMQLAIERAEADGHYGALQFLRCVAARRLRHARYWPLKEAAPYALLLSRGAILVRGFR